MTDKRSIPLRERSGQEQGEVLKFAWKANRILAGAKKMPWTYYVADGKIKHFSQLGKDPEADEYGEKVFDKCISCHTDRKVGKCTMEYLSEHGYWFCDKCHNSWLLLESEALHDKAKSVEFWAPYLAAKKYLQIGVE